MAKLYARAATLVAQLKQATAILQAMSALLARIFAAGIAYVFQIFLAQSLGIENYGVFVTFWTWQVILTHIAVLGFDESVVKYLPKYLARGRVALAYSFAQHGLKFILISSIGTSVLCGSALWGAGDLLADRMYGSAVVLAIGLPILALELYTEGLARASGRYLLGIVPGYVLRPLVSMSILFALKLANVPLTAELALAVVIFFRRCCWSVYKRCLCGATSKRCLSTSQCRGKKSCVNIGCALHCPWC